MRADVSASRCDIAPCRHLKSAPQTGEARGALSVSAERGLSWPQRDRMMRGHADPHRFNKLDEDPVPAQRLGMRRHDLRTRCSILANGNPGPMGTSFTAGLHTRSDSL